MWLLSSIEDLVISGVKYACHRWPQFLWGIRHLSFGEMQRMRTCASKCLAWAQLVWQPMFHHISWSVTCITRKCQMGSVGTASFPSLRHCVGTFTLTFGLINKFHVKSALWGVSINWALRIGRRGMRVLTIPSICSTAPHSQPAGLK